MEIVFLNTFDGRIRQPLSQFLTDRAPKTDVFCFQESSQNPGGMQELAVALLPGFKSASAYKKISPEDDFSQTTYLSPDVRLLDQEVLSPMDQNVGLGLVTTVQKDDRQLTVCNFHGRSRPGDKLDTPERIDQSQQILDFFRAWAIPLIVGGDFNADIETECIRMFASAGYKNLIREYQIYTTRNPLAWKKHPLTPQLHSDYVFVSPDVPVSGFTVPRNEISDHLPLILETK